MATSILNDLIIYDNVPKRIANKWLYILKNCWEDIFSVPIFIQSSSFNLYDNSLRVSLPLPKVGLPNSPFETKDFLITLQMEIINNKELNKKNGEKIINFSFSIKKMKIIYLK